MTENSELILAIVIAIGVLAILIILPYLFKFWKFIAKKTKSKHLGQSSQIRLIFQLKDACDYLSKTKTGALITITKQIELDSYRTDGIALNADISSALIISIFHKNSPLHDGAIIIANNKITYASTYFKITSKSVDNRLGARHRAALGISEQTDSLTIVVSEQTGKISFVKNSNIINVEIDNFQEKLVETLV